MVAVVAVGGLMVLVLEVCGRCGWADDVGTKVCGHRGWADDVGTRGVWSPWVG